MSENIITIEMWLRSTLRVTTPLLLAALGGALSLQVGICNIALEGFMIFGCFFGVLVSYMTGSSFLAVIGAGLIGSIVALIFAFCLIKLDGDPIVVGLSINLLGWGITAYLLTVIFNETGSFSSPKIISIPKLTLPIISNLPIIGKIFVGQTVLMYISWILVLALYIVIYRTTWGLHIRSVGENPYAAEAVGINVNLVRYLSLMCTGFFCGMAGAELSLGFLTIFSEDMTAGRGFLSFSATIIGSANPFFVAGAALLFGAAESLALQLQGLQIPVQFPLMAPYIITILTMVFFSKNFRLLLKSKKNKFFKSKKTKILLEDKQ